MGLISRLRAAYRSLTREQFQELGLLQPASQAGVVVTQAKALTVSAYWCGLNVIAGDIGVIDRFLYRRRDDGTRERATTHPVYRIIHDAPNPYMTPQVFWQTLVAHALSWGNAYAEIEWDGAMRPIGLWPIPPNQIQPLMRQTVDARGRKRSELVYVYAGDTLNPLPAEDIVHIPGLGFDGITGYSVVQIAREALGLSLAAERFGAQFFGEGAWPGLAVSHPGELSDTAHARLEQSINSVHQPSAGGRSHRVILLEEGMSVSKPITISPDDSQFLETRQFQIEEMARILRCPVHKLMHKANDRPGGNLEASQLDYLQSALLQWTTRIEQECNRKLLSSSQRGTFYVEHLFEKMLKADVTTRVAAQSAWVAMGAMTAEYVAQLENFPPPPPKAEPKPAPTPPASPPNNPPPDPTPEPLGGGDGGDAGSGARATPPLTPAQIAAYMRAYSWPPTTWQWDPSAPAAAASAPPAPVPEPSTARARLALRELVEERVSQYVRRESGRVRQASRAGAQAFEGWIASFYQREQAVLVDVLAPLVRCNQALEGSDGDAREVSEAIARAHITRSRDGLLALGHRNLEFEADRLAKSWEKARPSELVDQVMALRAEEESHAA